MSPRTQEVFIEYIAILFKLIDSGDHICRKKKQSSSNQPLYNRKKREKKRAKKIYIYIQKRERYQPD